MGWADREEEQFRTKSSGVGEGVGIPCGGSRRRVSLFVGLQGKVCGGDLVVAEQNTNGSSKEDAREWQVCEAETHQVGITEGHVERLGRAGLTFF